ncbi:MAG: archaemetzincin [Pirellulales bacterium]
MGWKSAFRRTSKFAALLLAVVGIVVTWAYVAISREYAEVETRLAPLAVPLGTPRPGDWLDAHEEPGQTFAEYFAALPVRATKEKHTIYLCLLGDFNPAQQAIMDQVREYMEIFFHAPVKIHRRAALDEIPDSAKRRHLGFDQIRASYVLDDWLPKDQPADALAYICFTTSDLYPSEDWNYVFGLANLHERRGVWSIHRFGDPAESEAAAQLCLRRTLSIAAHETGHIFTLYHCTVNECNMNGCNHLPELDRHPLHLCPICLRKMCWNLAVKPATYLLKLQAFFHRNGFDDEAAWYEQAAGKFADAGG